MSTPVVPPEIYAAGVNLLAQSGWGALESIVPLAGGRNNRVYRVVGQSASGILKQYHRSEGSGRDRFAAELAWYQYCQSTSVGQVPRLWSADQAANCALFSEISGRKLLPGEVTVNHVRQAAEFFSDVNRHRNTTLAARLPLAADACLSIADYLNQIERRIQRLQAVPVIDEPTVKLQSWLVGTLVPLWCEVRATIKRGSSSDQLVAIRSVEERCVSPSDFGFHNAILTPTGTLKFLDFEYAGWDDPAKMVCDFYWQVEIPVPKETLPLMLEATTSQGEGVSERVRRLFPLMGIKWCAIVLNEFIDDGRLRREFAGGVAVVDSTRNRQLQIASRISNDVQELMRREVC